MTRTYKNNKWLARLFLVTLKTPARVAHLKKAKKLRRP